MDRTGLRTAGFLLAVLLLVAACSDGGLPSQPPTPAGPRLQRYVALGDSYSAGPLIPTTDLAGGCARSDHDYPSLVARRLHVRTFVDVTCSGATTADLAGYQHPFPSSRVPPQLRAVTRRADLVTIGIGGNDLDLFGTLVNTCTRLRSADPAGAPCARHFAARHTLASVLRTIGGRVRGSLLAIRHKAPDATVVLVGYLRLVPEHGTCRALPLATGDYAFGRRVSRALAAAMRQAAHRAGVLFVDMYAASRGHSACAPDPWVNGAVTARQRALAYHPLLSGMRADARGVLAAVRRP
jgi:lysophospholipase L1-like esterase